MTKTPPQMHRTPSVNAGENGPTASVEKTSHDMIFLGSSLIERSYKRTRYMPILIKANPSSATSAPCAMSFTSSIWTA